MSFAPHKTRIAILRGGPSSEYENSLTTGHTILENLPEEYHPLDVVVDRNGDWYHSGFKKPPEKIIQNVDLVWNVMHSFGESALVHKVMADFSVPFIGSDHISSGLTQNKKATNDVLVKFGIKVPHSIFFEVEKEYESVASKIGRSLPFPIIIKPVDQGSSFGVSLARSSFEVKKCLEDALRFSNRIMAEEYIEGSVVSSGVIENFRGEDHYPLAPFVVSGRDIDEQSRDKVRQIASNVHSVLHLKDYSQSDFVVHPKRGVFFLEVNTIPKIHEESKFISSLKSVGASIKDFVRHILAKAVKNK